MSATLLVAVAAWVGAWGAVATPLPVGGAIAAVGAWWRRPVLIALGVLLLAGALAARAEAGLEPASASEWSGWATLRSDPEPVGPAVRAIVEVDGRRLEAWARGRPAAVLDDRLTGEVVELVGSVRPPPPDAPWLARRHVVGRIEVDQVGAHRTADPIHGAANGLRRTLAAGAEPLGDPRRALFLGLVLGDERDHDPVVVDDFLGSGLTHLMAVSGSNVAFVIVLLTPALRRLRPAPRLVAVLGALALFALVTRFEPSVMRATAMAATAAVATAAGRAESGRRTLAVAVAVVLLIDPFLVRSVGFQLSVLATAGILVLAPAIARRLPGPRLLATALSVTAAAQLAVAPLLVAVFGGLPVASLPANLLAAPIAGPVMIWGLPAGLLAGIVGPPVDGWLHAPTGLLVGWIGAVARWSSAVPLGELGAAHVAVLVVGVVLVGVAGRRARTVVPVDAGVAADRPGSAGQPDAVALVGAGSGRSATGVVAAAGWVLVLGTLAAPGVALARAPAAGALDIAGGAVLHRHGDAVVLVVDGAVRADEVLAGLRRRGVDAIDVVVCRSGGARVAELVALVGQRHPLGVVLAPVGHRVPGGVVPPAGARLAVGGLEVQVEPRAGALHVEVGVRGDEWGARPVTRAASGRRLPAGSALTSPGGGAGATPV
ncbi:MAG TPA: ComEC/Rec2 family competence protein [Acidimicrobiales bacterium]|nr:ComEC/Rec2 family competence protein [Acidimicrobiales bacterium]